MKKYFLFLFVLFGCSNEETISTKDLASCQELANKIGEELLLQGSMCGVKTKDGSTSVIRAELAEGAVMGIEMLDFIKDSPRRKQCEDKCMSIVPKRYQDSRNVQYDCYSKCRKQ